MRYCTLIDLEQAIPQQVLIWLSNDDPAATHYDEAIVEKAISYASELCDGYLLSRYSLPLVSVPVIVRDSVVYLARYWLYQRRPEGEIPEGVKDAQKSALDTLAQIQRGIVSLNIKQSSSVADVKSTTKFKVKSSKPYFGADTLGKWR